MGRKLLVIVELDESDVELIMDNDPHELIGAIKPSVEEAIRQQWGSWMIDCPTCKGKGVLGDYVEVLCYQCSGSGKIDEVNHTWKYLEY